MLESDLPSSTSSSHNNTQHASIVEHEWTPPKDPWDLTDILESSSASYEQLPEWDVQYVSRTSQERVQVYTSQRETTSHASVPTLQELASLSLPPPDPSLAETEPKIYALQRQRKHYQYVSQQVAQLAEPRVASIQALEDWQEKQDAVDLLFEDIEVQLVAQEEVLGKHPKFGAWVERALEAYLKQVQQQQNKGESETETTDDSTKTITMTDADALPVFMDCMDASLDDTAAVAPKILHPLQPRPGPHAVTAGRMVEEWELAAHKGTKRILLRQSTRQIAQALVNETTKRVYVHGPQGVGKTAALASIVASARVSGAIVLYMPNGDDLHKNGFYLEANAKQPGLFDLPVLSKNACSDLLTSHDEALRSVNVPMTVLEKICTSDQLKQLGASDSVSATDLLQLGAANVSLAAPAFSAVVEALMEQDQVDFVMVMDEFNCFFEKSHYYHGDYQDAKRPVPYNQITLLKPALDAMAITNRGDDVDESRPLARLMKRGAIIAATTESHAIARKITDALTADAKEQQYPSPENDTIAADIQVVRVPRFSILEMDHVLANFEATGVGKLRLDRGETLRNEQEVARLRMVSGGVGQRLLDASIM